MENAPDAMQVLIVGGGLIGLALARELHERDVEVVLLERDRIGQATSRVSAGMLSPDAEIGFEEIELYHFSRESLRRWPAFAEDLEKETGLGCDYRTEGTLVVADDRDAVEIFRRIFQFQQEQGCNVEWVTGRRARSIEPYLSPTLHGAIWAPDDHQVDPIRVLEALERSVRERGIEIHEQAEVAQIEPDAERPSVTLTDGRTFEADRVVVAAGPWSPTIDGLEEARPPVRAVKGQVLELKMKVPFDLTHVVRGTRAYVVPKSDGRLLVGATSEEMGFDEEVTAGGIFQLLEGARDIVPGIDELEFLNADVGFRPASRDHMPLLGPSGLPGITYATGHYRHGVLLAPLSAEVVAEALVTGETSETMRPFLPARFAAAE